MVSLSISGGLAKHEDRTVMEVTSLGRGAGQYGLFESGRRAGSVPRPKYGVADDSVINCRQVTIGSAKRPAPPVSEHRRPTVTCSPGAFPFVLPCDGITWSLRQCCCGACSISLRPRIFKWRRLCCSSFLQAASADKITLCGSL